ncbi:MAG: peptidoglycan DD-metalloendopeptidase family protein [Bacteroidia bacterium]|nr:peptidoglycan DD-metalloendopeptidase family protein [Bacteroidia bacterium]
MNSKEFSSFLSNISHDNINVIDDSILKSEYIPIDLSISNNDLDMFDITSSKAWEDYIATYLKNQGKSVAFGGYLEHRNLYKRSKTFNQQNPETERNIHLGIDIWHAAGTSVLAAFNGEIHSFKDNDAYGDYGPTIILKHKTKGVQFFTLYGHLSRESLSKIKIGNTVKQGECIAKLGEPEVNGVYAPHLHFQIIRDIQGNFGDYPGVSSLKDLEFYKENCPDPNLVLMLS